MKQIIFTNWSFIRFLRLAMGLAILVQAFLAGDAVFVLVGLLFTAMPVFNMGCCGTNGCYVPPVRKEINDAKEITYEEVG